TTTTADPGRSWSRPTVDHPHPARPPPGAGSWRSRMNLIKIGTQVVNLDLVTSIDLDTEAIDWAKNLESMASNAHVVPAIRLHIGIGAAEQFVELIGAEADAFRAWLRDQALDLLPAGADD